MNWMRIGKSFVLAILIIVGGIATVVGGVYAIVSALQHSAVETDMFAVALYSGGSLFMLYILIVSYALSNESRREEIDDLNKRRDTGLSFDNSDVIENLLNTLDYIGQYYTANINNYKTIFVVSVAACVLGFVAIVSPIVLAATRPDFDAMAPAVLSSLGGVLLEFIALSLFYMYRSTHDLFVDFHTHLSNLQKLLAALTMIDKIENKDKRDAVRVNIVNKVAEIDRSISSDTQSNTHTKDRKSESTVD